MEERNIIEFTYNNEPVPFERMNKLNMWAGRVQRYLKYKGDLTVALMSHYGRNEKHDKKTRYSLSLQVYRVRDAGDLDNYAKGVIDAIAKAGLVWNDKAIIKYVEPFEMLLDKQNPRIQFKLRKLT